MNKDNNIYYYLNCYYLLFHKGLKKNLFFVQLKLNYLYLDYIYNLFFFLLFTFLQYESEFIFFDEFDRLLV